MSDDFYDLDSNSTRNASYFDDDFDYSASPFDAQATPAFGFPAVSEEEATRTSSKEPSKNGSYSGKSSNAGKGGKNKKSSKAHAASSAKGSTKTMKDDANNYDFLWEDDKQRRSAKGDAGTTTVVESDTDYLLLPHPDIFNSYPPEVQRKIMEWADRDVRARRDDESLRQDALVRARAARERTAVTVPVAIIILCIVCAAVTGIATHSALFVIAFLAIALAIILSVYFTKKNDLFAYSEEYEEEDETGEE